MLVWEHQKTDEWSTSGWKAEDEETHTQDSSSPTSSGANKLGNLNI